MIGESKDHYTGRPTVQTASGLYFNLHEPEFRLFDIGHALSYNCRYNGHTRDFYSVAEHSMLVSVLMEELDLGDPREGLMHDATEAYLSDIPAPFKHLLPDWQEIDRVLTEKIRDHYKLPASATPGLKEADILALFIEAYDLLPDEGAGFQDPHGLRDKAIEIRSKGLMIRCFPPAHAHEWFQVMASRLGIGDPE